MKVLYAEWFDYDVGHVSPNWFLLRTQLEFFSSADSWRQGQPLSYGVIKARWFAYGVLELPPGVHEYKLRWFGQTTLMNTMLRRSSWFGDLSDRIRVGSGCFVNQEIRVASEPLSEAELEKTFSRFPVKFDRLAPPAVPIETVRLRLLVANGVIPPEEEDECPICTEEFANGVEPVKCPWGHRFHRKCLAEWKRKKSTCPVCRGDLVEEKQEPPPEVSIDLGPRSFTGRYTITGYPTPDSDAPSNTGGFNRNPTLSTSNSLSTRTRTPQHYPGLQQSIFRVLRDRPYAFVFADEPSTALQDEL